MRIAPLPLVACILLLGCSAKGTTDNISVSGKSAVSAPTIRMAAEQGDPDAAYTLSLEASDPVERFRLLLIAAERGYTAAQEEAARAYYTGIGAPQNYVHAYAWALLAQARTGDISFTSGLEEQMTKTQIVEAQQLAENLRVQIESNKKDVCQKFGNKYANKGVSCP